MIYMKIIKYLLIIIVIFNTNVYADINIEFENWKKDFKKIAIKKYKYNKYLNLVLI